MEEEENSSDSKNTLDPVEVDDHVAEGVGELILVVGDLDKVCVIQVLRLHDDGNDGEEEAEKHAEDEVEPPKDQDSHLEGAAAAELVDDWALGHSEAFSSS